MLVKSDRHFCPQLTCSFRRTQHVNDFLLSETIPSWILFFHTLPISFYHVYSTSSIYSSAVAVSQRLIQNLFSNHTHHSFIWIIILHYYVYTSFPKLNCQILYQTSFRFRDYVHIAFWNCGCMLTRFLTLEMCKIKLRFLSSTPTTYYFLDFSLSYHLFIVCVKMGIFLWLSSPTFPYSNILE